MEQFRAITTSGNSVRFDGGMLEITSATGEVLAAIPIAAIALVGRSGRDLAIQIQGAEPSRLTFESMLDAERLEYLLTSRGAPGGAASRQSAAPATPWLKTASGKALLASLIVAVTLLLVTIALCIAVATMLDDDAEASSARSVASVACSLESPERVVMHADRVLS